MAGCWFSTLNFIALIISVLPVSGSQRLGSASERYGSGSGSRCNLEVDPNLDPVPGCNLEADPNLDPFYIYI